MKATFSGRRKRVRRVRESFGSNRQAVMLIGIAVFLLLSLMAVSLVRHERAMQSLRPEWPSLPWNPAWPAMPAPLQGLREDVVRAAYAFAGTKPDVMEHIPCFCGCRLQGHHSAHDCFVKHRSADGVVTEWDNHGLMCPLAMNITGDVSLWHEQGDSVSVIRQRIDREFGARGPATDTPRPR
jgi:hypothetical protein